MMLATAAHRQEVEARLQGRTRCKEGLWTFMLQRESNSTWDLYELQGLEGVQYCSPKMAENASEPPIFRIA